MKDVTKNWILISIAILAMTIMVYAMFYVDELPTSPAVTRCHAYWLIQRQDDGRWLEVQGYCVTFLRKNGSHTTIYGSSDMKIAIPNPIPPENKIAIVDVAYDYWIDLGQLCKKEISLTVVPFTSTEALADLVNKEIELQGKLREKLSVEIPNNH